MDVLSIRNIPKHVTTEVEKRIKEFEETAKDNEKRIFSELCFCLLTAGYTAEGGIRIQKEIGNGFLTMSRSMLEKKLRKLGHRFPKSRAEYIVKARKHLTEIKRLIENETDSKKIRETLVTKIKGLGYKEASHFLRNVGFKDVAIIDRHVLRFLKKTGFEVRTLTKKRYLEAEKRFEQLAKTYSVGVPEFDLYVWYSMTGKVLK